MRAEVYGIHQRGATAAGNTRSARDGSGRRSLRQRDAHASEEAAEAELDLGTFPLVTPDALQELLIRTLQAGQPRRERVIAPVDVVLVG